MILNNNFIFDFPSYVAPAFRISPFKTDDIIINKHLNEVNGDNNFEEFIDKKYLDKKYTITADGRSAIGMALEQLNLRKNDIVTIITTSNNLYISGCVTSKIEEYCQWSRNLEENTKVILINHEFGYCVEDVEYYKSLGLPIIEDFAHSFISNNSKNTAGIYGDFLIFSLSKFFPIQVGGLLIYNQKYNVKEKLETSINTYISNVVSHYIGNIENFKKRRLVNYEYYKKLFNVLNIVPFFKLNENNYPAVFCFEVPKVIDLNDMKIYINSHGIESSIFYGENAYFVPNHQNLKKEEIDFIFNVVKIYLNKNGVL
jgi:hypothetical protein